MPLWKSGEIRLHFESFGHGEPVLLLHGLGSSSRDWEDQVSVFAECYRVIIPDRVGSIACPTCVISGEYDFIPLAMKERYTKKLANGELKVIPRSGHFTPVDAPQPFNQAVMWFLAMHT
jgi:pimeloyl-ACP methyl ester carboxylesterase